MVDLSGSVDPELMKKYDYKAFMYTEYPHKRFWSEGFGQEEYRVALKSLCSKGGPALLYVHMPYCHTQCLFCTCYVKISLNYEDVKRYMDFLCREIDLLHDFFVKNSIAPEIREIHLGGGSPTYLQEKEFDRLLEKLQTIADLKGLSEFSIEIDPRRVKKDRMKYYHEKGISRISFGIQDFDIGVQKAVNRVQPASLTENLLAPEIRKLFKNGVNFDIICGLPRQTRESIRETIKKVVEISPDRVCLNYLDIAPDFNPHQLKMPMDEIPDGPQRKELFLEALEILTAAGYVRTGYDHFAKPGDDVAEAMKKGRMQWNSLGTTPGRCVDLIGIGVHSYSRLGPDYYSQNTYDLGQYESALTQGRFPVYRGMKLDEDDRIRRDVIQRLRNYFCLDTREFGKRHGIDFSKYFGKELSELTGFAKDGIVRLSEDAILITELGQQFSNVVCRVFDAHTRKSPPDLSREVPQFARMEIVGRSPTTSGGGISSRHRSVRGAPKQEGRKP